MFRARALAVAVLLVFYGAVGARQPAVRTSVPLPASAADINRITGVDAHDRAQLLLHLVRLLFDAPDGQSAQDATLRASLAPLLAADPARDAPTVPLPLDSSIWRETILQRNVPDTRLVAAILSDRSTALLYHGLASLDDETLGWLGPDRETLVFLRRHAATFATFGRSIRVRAGRVIVPGGEPAEPIWRALVGVEPSRAGAFVQRLFRDDRLAWFYDTLAHLEPSTLTFALGPAAAASSNDRIRDLVGVFGSTAHEWNPSARPFNRPAVDPALVLSLLDVNANGELAGPSRRNIWDRVFQDERETEFSDITDDIAKSDGTASIDATWIARRTSLVSPVIGRRRLDTLLFAQRVFRRAEDNDRVVATALRTVHAFPALALTLERIGVSEPATYARAGRHAAAINAITRADARAETLTRFQSTLGIIDRARRSGGIPAEKARALVTSILALDIAADDGYGSRFAAWLQTSMVPAFVASVGNTWTSAEDVVLAAVAGIRDGASVPTVEWEGRQYTIDASRAEFKRLQRIRQHQRRRTDKSPDLAASLIDILYATCLGDADGAGARAAEVARRHDWADPWRLPREDHSGDAWRVRGSLLGLDIALARLALRRLDSGDMPSPPTLSIMERVTAMTTVALMSPADLTDATRDEVAAAIRRGRARVQNLTADRAQVERLANDAGMSEWRREALGWTLEHDRAAAQDRFSMVDLFWLGAPRENARRALDAWGASTLAIDGALILRMPPAVQWELRAGRPANGQLATRGADVALRIAEVLSDLRLPASLAPGVLAFAMQDVIDSARPAYFDDWGAFERSARSLTRDRIADYVAALAAGGPLVPSTSLQDKN